MRTKSLQLCLTFYDPTDCSPLGSSVHGFLQSRILKWVVMPSSRGSSQPGSEPSSLSLLHWQAGFLPLASPGKPFVMAAQEINTVITFFFLSFFPLFPSFLCRKEHTFQFLNTKNL